MRLKEKITLITENKGNARIWIQGDTDVENHGFTDGQVFTVSYGDSQIVLQLTGLKRQKGMRVDKEFKRKHNLPKNTMILAINLSQWLQLIMTRLESSFLTSLRITKTRIITA